MFGRDEPEIHPEVIEVVDATNPIGDDAITSRTARTKWWRVPRNQYLIVAVLLIVAVIAAYQLGNRTNKAAPSPLAPTPTTVTSTPIDRSAALAETGQRCATQIGKQLQLGIQIVNQSTHSLTLMTLTPTLPLGGLQATSQAIGTCGQLTLTTPVAGTELASGTTTWLTMTFDVLVDCPGAIPVQFTVITAQDSSSSTVNLGGFPDLGGVSYSGCASGS